jgi:hypothetical protein
MVAMDGRAGAKGAVLDMFDVLMAGALAVEKRRLNEIYGLPESDARGGGAEGGTASGRSAKLEGERGRPTFLDVAERENEDTTSEAEAEAEAEAMEDGKVETGLKAALETPVEAREKDVGDVQASEDADEMKDCDDGAADESPHVADEFDAFLERVDCVVRDADDPLPIKVEWTSFLRTVSESSVREIVGTWRPLQSAAAEYCRTQGSSLTGPVHNP